MAAKETLITNAILWDAGLVLSFPSPYTVVSSPCPYITTRHSNEVATARRNHNTRHGDSNVVSLQEDTDRILLVVTMLGTVWNLMGKVAPIKGFSHFVCCNVTSLPYVWVYRIICSASADWSMHIHWAGPLSLRSVQLTGRVYLYKEQVHRHCLKTSMLMWIKKALLQWLKTGFLFYLFL